nr:hypothetical protein [Enterobacter ludwigii]
MTMLPFRFSVIKGIADLSMKQVHLVLTSIIQLISPSVAYSIFAEKDTPSLTTNASTLLSRAETELTDSSTSLRFVTSHLTNIPQDSDGSVSGGNKSKL